MFDVSVQWITQNNFVEYFNKPAGYGPIKDKMKPPIDVVEILIGCGPEETIGEKIKLAAISDSEELFNQRRFEYAKDDVATANRNYFSYYSTNLHAGLGFRNG